MSNGPLSKAARWAKAILGRAPVPGEAIGMLFGKPCIVSVEKDDRDYGRVVDVYPAVTRVAPTPIVTAPVVTSGPPVSDEGPAAEWDGSVDDRSIVADPIPF